MTSTTLPDNDELPPKQFAVRLAPYNGEYHNFFSCGSFEKLLKRARLIQRFDLGKDTCMLLFEELRAGQCTPDSGCQ
jgi:hypothetical protein